MSVSDSIRIYFYILVLHTSHQVFRQVPKTPAKNPLKTSVKNALLTPKVSLTNDLLTSNDKKNPPVHKAYLIYIPKYPAYRPPRYPLLEIKSLIASDVDLNLPSLSNC